MPLDDRGRLRDDERILPVAPSARQQSHKPRSKFVSRGRFAERCSTPSWWRRARTSKANWLCVRNKANAAKTKDRMTFSTARQSGPAATRPQRFRTGAGSGGTSHYKRFLGAAGCKSPLVKPQTGHVSARVQENEVSRAEVHYVLLLNGATRRLGVLRHPAWCHDCGSHSRTASSARGPPT